MNTKILLLALVTAAVSSCSTAYKSAQTPDDVYYSPVRVIEDKNDNDDDEQDQANNNAEDRRTKQAIRDRRWRTFDDYDYSYNNSPYKYCTCNCTHSNYYYNPKFGNVQLYNTTPIVNTTPRKGNLNGYNNNVQVSTPTKSNGAASNTKYNNSNKKEGFFGKVIKAISSPSTNPSSSNDNTPSSNTRSYSPSTGSGSSSTPSSGGSSGGTVTRPGRGG